MSRFKNIVNGDGIISVNCDENDLLFFERELTHILAKTYEKRYPEIKARMLFPVSFEIPNWVENYEYYEFDEAGEAKTGSTYGDDLPRVDVKRDRNILFIVPILTSYGYNISEIRKSRALGLNLEQRKANVAKRACLRRENNLAFFGLPDKGMYGLLNNPKISKVTVAATGTGSSTLWSLKTPDKIVDDINALLDSIYANTKQEIWADTLLISGPQWANIAGKRLNSTSDVTVMEWIKEKLKVKGIMNVEPLNELTGTGTAGANIMVAYKRDPDFIQLHVPQDFEQFPAQLKGFNFTIPCHMRTGGLMIRDTVAIGIAEGI